MPIPLPYKIVDPIDPEGVQGNFDELAKQFPLSRQHLKLEPPKVVGASGAPAFQNGWLNYDTTAWRGVRFWKDPVGVVHVEGLVKSGVLNTTVFVLPAGYRPGSGVLFPTDTNTGHGRVDVSPTGNVVAVSGGNGYFSLSAVHFKQEQ